MWRCLGRFALVMGHQCRLAGRRGRERAIQEIYEEGKRIYCLEMSKHLVDIDEDALRTARAKFGSETIKETVNRALRQAGGEHQRTVKRRLDLLAGADLAAREQAWR